MHWFDWFADWLIDWLIDYLIDWMINWELVGFYSHGKKKEKKSAPSSVCRHSAIQLVWRPSRPGLLPEHDPTSKSIRLDQQAEDE